MSKSSTSTEEIRAIVARQRQAQRARMASAIHKGSKPKGVSLVKVAAK